MHSFQIWSSSAPLLGQNKAIEPLESHNLPWEFLVESFGKLVLRNLLYFNLHLVLRNLYSLIYIFESPPKIAWTMQDPVGPKMVEWNHPCSWMFCGFCLTYIFPLYVNYVIDLSVSQYTEIPQEGFWSPTYTYKPCLQGMRIPWFSSSYIIGLQPCLSIPFWWRLIIHKRIFPCVTGNVGPTRNSQMNAQGSTWRTHEHAAWAALACVANCCV
jgi:hypothetical protein